MPFLSFRFSGSFSHHVGSGPTLLLFQHVLHCFRAQCGAAEGIVLSSWGYCPRLMYVRLFTLLGNLSEHGRFSKETVFILTLVHLWPSALLGPINASLNNKYTKWVFSLSLSLQTAQLTSWMWVPAVSCGDGVSVARPAKIIWLQENKSVDVYYSHKMPLKELVHNVLS